MNFIECLKKHYDTIENLSYIGMVFWFVPAIFCFGSLLPGSHLRQNYYLAYFVISMFLLHFLSALVFFDGDRLWRWLQ